MHKEYIHTNIVIDSMGGIPSGISDGVITSFGEYDECLDIKYFDSFKSIPVYGKYCIVRPVIPISDLKIFDNFNGFDFLTDGTNEWIKLTLNNNIIRIKALLTTSQYTDKIYGFHLGVCIPSVCEAQDLSMVLNAGNAYN